TRLDQCSQAGIVITRIVIDNRQFTRTLLNQSVNQLCRMARATESTDKHGGAIKDVGDRYVYIVQKFIDHLDYLYFPLSELFMRQCWRKPLFHISIVLIQPRARHSTFPDD